MRFTIPGAPFSCKNQLASLAAAALLVVVPTPDLSIAQAAAPPAAIVGELPSSANLPFVSLAAKTTKADVYKSTYDSVYNDAYQRILAEKTGKPLPKAVKGRGAAKAPMTNEARLRAAKEQKALKSANAQARALSKQAGRAAVATPAKAKPARAKPAPRAVAPARAPPAAARPAGRVAKTSGGPPILPLLVLGGGVALLAGEGNEEEAATEKPKPKPAPPPPPPPPSPPPPPPVAKSKPATKSKAATKSKKAAKDEEEEPEEAGTSDAVSGVLATGIVGAEALVTVGAPVLSALLDVTVGRKEGAPPPKSASKSTSKSKSKSEPGAKRAKLKRAWVRFAGSSDDK